MIAMAGVGGGVVSAQSYVPIALQSNSFNNDVVLEATAPQNDALPYVTASIDQGVVNSSNNLFYEQGYNLAEPQSGLPTGGATFTSQTDANHNYYIQPLTPASGTTSNNALLIGTGTSAPASGTLSFSTPQAFAGLSLLAAGGNGGGSVNLTINYANGAPSASTTVNIADWFSNTPVAWDVQGRAIPTTGASQIFYYGNNPNIYEVDFTPPDTTDAITSITVSGFTGGDVASIFGISGVISGSTTSVTYAGGGFANGSSGFKTGNGITFDDSYGGSHNVAVTAGVEPGSVIFNNSTNTAPYNLTGGAIAGNATVSVSGGGVVNFSNANTYTGDTIISAGTVNVLSGGAIASNTIDVGSGSTFNVAAGGTLSAPDPFINDNGTVIFSNPTRFLYGLNGSGSVTLNSTALTVIRMSETGTIGGVGSLTYNAGSFTVNQASNLNVSGGVTVNGATASLVVNDGSGQAGLSNGSVIPLTLNNGGSLTGSGVWAGNVSIGSAGGGISGSAGNTLTVNGVITGSGPVTLVNQSSSTLSLNAPSPAFTGAVTIAGDGSPFNTETVNVNAPNALGSGDLAFAPSNSFQVIVNLNANQSTTSLSSPITGNFTVAGNGNPVTLTISNGNTAAGVPATFGASITGNVTLVKTGTGNQIINGNNFYSGGTYINGGTLTVGSTNALAGGNNPVIFGKTGTLVLGAATSFTNANFSTFQLNYGSGGNPATVQAGNALYLTDSNGGEGNSAFMTTPVVISDKSGFTAQFTYTPLDNNNNGTADGITFVLAADPRGDTAVSSSNGGDLGYSGSNKIVDSAAIAFETYPFGATGYGTQLVTGGVKATQYQSTGNVDIGIANTSVGYFYWSLPTVVTLTYNGSTQTLTESLSGTNLFYSNGGLYYTGATDTVTYTGVDISSILGGASGGAASAYIGFTGGTGGQAGSQEITNFSFNNNGGAVSISNPITVAVNASSTIQFPLGASSTGVSVGAITVNPGGKLVLSTLAATNASRGVLTVPSITFTPSSSTTATYTGQFDIGKNDLDITSQSLAQVTAMVATGYNLTGGGKWNGPGITSSLAASNSLHLTAVGVIQNNQGGTPIYTATNPFDGTVPGAGDVLVKYTYFGDANLDGKVDGSDYSLIDAGYASKGTLTGWYYGDFNYDGVIDGSDYALIDNAFNNQGSAQTVYNAAIVASETAQVASAPASAVPEPASLGLLAVSGLALVRRRSRR